MDKKPPATCCISLGLDCIERGVFSYLYGGTKAHTGQLLRWVKKKLRAGRWRATVVSTAVWVIAASAYSSKAT
ncbi:MAG: hypothetical protein V2J12_04740 [Gammaproteobacteria bacterium]|nr:hypothetical protein [Gammaproteobacteria bacterium]